MIGKPMTNAEVADWKREIDRRGTDKQARRYAIDCNKTFESFEAATFDEAKQRADDCVRSYGTVRQLIYGRRRSAFERVVDSGKVKYRLCQFAE